jgi:hypothetical protein
MCAALATVKGYTFVICILLLFNTKKHFFIRAAVHSKILAKQSNFYFFV